MQPLLTPVDPMGIYVTLYKFLAACEVYMGDPGTIPLSQGYPLVNQIPGGPLVPEFLEVTEEDRKYPKAWGNAVLRDAIVNYYNTFYGANITPENVMIFAGGRPGLMAILGFLDPEAQVLIEETEYTPYFDMLELLGKSYKLIPSNVGNAFKTSLATYRKESEGRKSLIVKSNPCNPTGIVWRGEQLEGLVELASTEGRGVLVDEAYEFFQAQPESAIQHVDHIDNTNLFVSNAATKGLQVPGFRIGWVIAAKQHIETMASYSSFAMGGVCGPAQRGVAKMLEIDRVTHARETISKFYGEQRERYGNLLTDLGVKLFTGDGGFYHWGALPSGLTAEAFNERLFTQKTAILPGTLCDMARRGEKSPLAEFFRLSFGPRTAEDFEGDAAVLRSALT